MPEITEHASDSIDYGKFVAWLKGNGSSKEAALKTAEALETVSQYVKNKLHYPKDLPNINEPREIIQLAEKLKTQLKFRLLNVIEKNRYHNALLQYAEYVKDNKKGKSKDLSEPQQGLAKAENYAQEASRINQDLEAQVNSSFQQEESTEKVVTSDIIESINTTELDAICAEKYKDANEGPQKARETKNPTFLSFADASKNLRPGMTIHCEAVDATILEIDKETDIIVASGKIKRKNYIYDWTPDLLQFENEYQGRIMLEDGSYIPFVVPELVPIKPTLKNINTDVTEKQSGDNKSYKFTMFRENHNHKKEINEVFTDRIFENFRGYCSGNNLVFLSDLDDSEIDLYKKICAPTDEEYWRLLKLWQKAIAESNATNRSIVQEENYAAKTAQAHSRPAESALAAPPKPTLDPAIIEQLTDVLSAHFTNGFRLNSPIELVRFRSFASEDLDEEITLTDEELKSYIAACGTHFDGKVYAVPAKAKERIKEFAEEYFADGAQAIFFSEFYAKNENWLFGANVVSEDMLIVILRRLFPKLSFTQTYFGYTDASVFAALESEILRVWGDDVLLTYEQLAERLQYIPLERIKYALGQNGDFIWSSVETFSHVSRIDISEDEREAIRNAAVQECNARGYASITDLPLGEIEERNYELSFTAVHNAVFRICMSDKFDKSGKIVTRKGDTLDALTIMKDYCRTIDKCSLNDLLNYEKELTGEIHRWMPMEAGNTVLIRIDKDTYVADRYVQFDADAVDAAIELFVEHDYLPLKSFTTFGIFPDCGQTWNLFLLESYCRRFSKKFRFDALSVNSRNAGAVIRKSCGLNYTEIMTDAVANADVSLSDSAVGRFLFDLGYTGRSTTAKVREIIDRAKAMRERRD